MPAFIYISYSTGISSYKQFPQYKMYPILPHSYLCQFGSVPIHQFQFKSLSNYAGACMGLSVIQFRQIEPIPKWCLYLHCTRCNSLMLSTYCLSCELTKLTLLTSPAWRWRGIFHSPAVTQSWWTAGTFFYQLELTNPSCPDSGKSSVSLWVSCIVRIAFTSLTLRKDPTWHQWQHMQDWLDFEYAILACFITVAILRDLKKPSRNCSTLSLPLRVGTFHIANPISNQYQRGAKSRAPALPNSSLRFASELTSKLLKRTKASRTSTFYSNFSTFSRFIVSVFELFFPLYPWTVLHSFSIVWSVQLFTSTSYSLTVSKPVQLDQIVVSILPKGEQRLFEKKGNRTYTTSRHLLFGGKAKRHSYTAQKNISTGLLSPYRL